MGDSCGMLMYARNDLCSVFLQTILCKMELDSIRISSFQRIWKGTNRSIFLMVRMLHFDTLRIPCICSWYLQHFLFYRYPELQNHKSKSLYSRNNPRDLGSKFQITYDHYSHVCVSYIVTLATEDSSTHHIIINYQL